MRLNISNEGQLILKDLLNVFALKTTMYIELSSMCQNEINIVYLAYV